MLNFQSELMPFSGLFEGAVTYSNHTLIKFSKYLLGLLEVCLVWVPKNVGLIHSTGSVNRETKKMALGSLSFHFTR